MNILMTTEYYYGNPDMVRLSVELAKKGHRVNVLTSFSPSFYKFDNPEGVPGVNVFEAHPHVNIMSLPYTVTFPLAQAVRIIKQRRIQVCHSVMARATNSAAVSFIAKRLGVPHIHTVQGMGTRTGYFYVDFIAEMYDRTVVRQVFESAKKVVVLSKSLSEYAVEKGADPEKIVVIPNGVDCSVFDPTVSDALHSARAIREKFGISADSIVVGYIGRIVPVKGLKYLLRAMSQVKKKHPDVHLLIVGDGFEKNELQRMAKELRLDAHFAGWEKNVLPFYAAIDIFVLPSLLEGLSNSLLEAMAMGKAIIATVVGGNKDIILDGKNGFLVKPRDAQSISLKVNKLVESAPLRERISHFNRETALREFGWEKTVSRIEQTYRSVID